MLPTPPPVWCLIWSICSPSLAQTLMMMQNYSAQLARAQGGGSQAGEGQGLCWEGALSHERVEVHGWPAAGGAMGVKV